ncbi:MAG: DUF1499 domain-containing protein [Myxococcota bacterium]
MPLLSLLLSLACGSDAPPLPRTLAPCPSTPNCVSTRAPASDPHHIEPIAVSGDPDAFLARVRETVDAMPRTRLVDEGDDYQAWVFTTLVMRFRDDVQLELDRDANVLHFRSASRVGRSDLGVNRRRMEALRAALDRP